MWSSGVVELRHEQSDAGKEIPVGRPAPVLRPAARCTCKFFHFVSPIQSHEVFLKTTCKHFILKFAFFLVAFINACFTR